MTGPAESPSRAIAIVYAGYMHRGMGVVQHVLQLARSFEARGYEAVVLTLDRLPRGVRLLPHVVQGAANRVLPPWGFYARYAVGRRLFRRALARARRERPVCAVVFEDIYSAFPVDVPSIAVLHALQIHNLHDYRLSPARLSAARRHESRAIRDVPCPVAAVSEPYLRLVEHDLREAGCPIGRDVAVVPLGIDTSVYPAPVEARSGSRLEIVFAGYLEARKNVEFLPALAAALRGRTDWRLSIVGDGPLRGELEAAMAGAGDAVRFLGRFPHAEMPSVLPRFHVMVHPTRTESFAYTLLEGRLAGLWTLASAGLTVPDEFCDERLPLDPAQWADRIVAGRDTYLAPLTPARAAGIAALRSYYSADRMVADYCRLLGLPAERDQ